MKTVIKGGLKVLTAHEKKGHSSPPATKTVDIGKFPALNMTPPQALDALGTAGQHKGHRTWDQILLLGINAGVFIGFGGFFALNAATNSTGFVTYGFAGVQKILFALCFCAGLYLVVFTGSEMFTGNIGALGIALYQRKVSILDAIKNLFWAWIGNFIGGFLFAYFFCYLTSPGQFDNPTEVWVTAVKKMANHKVHYEWNVLLLKAMACNWAVSLAFFCATAAKDVPGKALLLALPIAGFFAAGYEHSVANMFIIPLGWLYGAPDVNMITYGYNIIMVTIGNSLGSLLMYVMVMLYVFDFRETFKHAESNFLLFILYVLSSGKIGKSPFPIKPKEKKEETPKEEETAKQEVSKKQAEKKDEEEMIDMTKEEQSFPVLMPEVSREEDLHPTENNNTQQTQVLPIEMKEWEQKETPSNSEL